MSKFVSTHNFYKIIITKDNETGNFNANMPALTAYITVGEMAYEAIEAAIESRLAMVLKFLILI